MPEHEDVTADDIKEAVASDMVDGVQSFSDGTNSVVQMDPQKRLDVADRLTKSEAAEVDWFGMRTRKMNGGEAWQ